MLAGGFGHGGRPQLLRAPDPEINAKAPDPGREVAFGLDEGLERIDRVGLANGEVNLAQGLQAALRVEQQGSHQATEADKF